MMSSSFSDNKRNIYLASCLYDCIEDNNNRAIKRLLIENGANPNIIIPDRGISPFHLAIGNGSEENAIEITKMFLAHNGNPNIRSDEKLTPVHIAAAWGRLQVLNILLCYGGNPSLTDEEDKTPLDYANQEGHLDVSNFLQNYSNDLNIDTYYEKLPYDITLDKVIINRGSIVAEYGICRQNNQDRLTFDTEEALASLPSKVVNSYVHNWCMTHAHIMDASNCYDVDKIKINRNSDKLQNNVEFNQLNEANYISSQNKDDLNDSCSLSEESFAKSHVSRESGILTIPLSDASQKADLRDLFNNCMIINSSNDSMTKTTNSSAYMTCESVNSFEKNISLIMTLDLTENSIDKIITSNRSQTNEKPKETESKTNNINTITNLTENINHMTNITCQLSQSNEIDDSNISISEEYKYVDKENDIILIEKRILVNPKTDEIKSTYSVNSKTSSKFSTLPSVLEYDTDTLRLELTARGEVPGPITKTTKRVYLKKLKRLQKENIFLKENRNVSNHKAYSMELEKTIRYPNWNNDLTKYKTLENIISVQFANPNPNKKWREGITKASFTYLLLDPRVTDNLPARAENLEPDDLWRTFLGAIFYVGKGKRSRPYSHLYEAVKYWKKTENTKISKRNNKIEYILNIWKQHLGVICLHVFQNVIPAEAYTREAAMIEALQLQNLCNHKCGDFYGNSAIWSEKQKRLLGVYLLYRSMLIFLNEGERQLRPEDIDK